MSDNASQPSTYSNRHAPGNGLSVCVCTYNRAPILREMLASVVAVQHTFNESDELIVIDNNSTDATKEVIQACKLPQLRYIHEAKQGLSNARNRAIREAKNQHVIFFDDDVWLREGVLAAYRQAYAEHPEVEFFGGQIEIGWPDGQPDWWVAEDLALLNGLLVKYNLGSEPMLYRSGDHFPYGANFGLRKGLFDAIGGFNPELGPLGEVIGRGDDTDFFTRAIEAGYQGMYLPEALVAHRFEAERIRFRYLIRYGIQKGLRLPRENSVARLLIRVTEQALRGLWQRLQGRRDRAFQCVINIGIALGQRRA